MKMKLGFLKPDHPYAYFFPCPPSFQYNYTENFAYINILWSLRPWNYYSSLIHVICTLRLHFLHSYFFPLLKRNFLFFSFLLLSFLVSLTHLKLSIGSFTFFLGDLTCFFLGDLLSGTCVLWLQSGFAL